MNNNQTKLTNQSNPKRFHLKTWQWVSVLAVVAVIVAGFFVWQNYSLREAKLTCGGWESLPCPEGYKCVEIEPYCMDCYGKCVPVPKTKCIKQEEVIAKEIEKANYCSISNDCASVFFTDCWHWVNRNNLPELQGKTNSFFDLCGYPMIKCPFSEDFEVKCVLGKCRAEFKENMDQIEGEIEIPPIMAAPSFDNECLGPSPLITTTKGEEYYLDGICQYSYSGELDKMFGKKVRIIGTVVEKQDDLLKQLYPNVIEVSEIKVIGEAEIETPVPPAPSQEECDDQCYLNLAQEQKDEVLCEKVKDMDLKSQCFGGIAVLKRDEKICQSAGQYQDQCYYTLANEIPKAELCRIIQDVSLRDICLSELARQKKDDTLCQGIEGQESHDWCYRDIAVMRDNEKGCQNIINPSLKNNCYLDIAVLKKDSSLCELSGDLREKCLAEVEK